MGVRLTEEQQAAVNAPVEEIIVSAAAGSGKTKVLSERIVKRIKGGETEIDRLLVVTFTRAAAAQMRERIYDALEAEYKATHSARLKRELGKVAAADICTIDAFCIDVVRKNFFRADVPPDFVPADAGETAILAQEVLDEVLEEFYAENDAAFCDLCDSVDSGKNDNNLRDMIKNLYGFASAFDEPEEWLDRAAANYTPGSEESAKLRDVLRQEAEDALRDAGKMLKSGIDAARDAEIEAYAEVYEKEAREFEKCFGNFSEEEIEEGFKSFQCGDFRGKRAPKGTDEIRKKNASAFQEEFKKTYAEAREMFELANAEASRSEAKVKALCRCTKRFGEKFLEEKLARRELDFSDCEHLALKILRESDEAADELRDKYDEIYIDEYQDTNALQDALFACVSRVRRGEPNLFIVGDIKQSIYRFRHSDPGIFAGRAEEAEKGEKAEKLILSKNFRSRRDVLDSVNAVFEKIMRADTATIDYNEEHRLRCGAAYTEYNENKSELYILGKSGAAESDEDEEMTDSQREAAVAADKIKKMVESGFLVSDGERMRKAKYGDFALLTRGIKGKTDMILNVFDLMGVPMQSSESRSFFSAAEVKTVIAALKAVDNPLNDIPLAATLRSPMFSFGENELVEIKVTGGKGRFFDNVKLCAENEGALGEKCAAFLAKLDEWRERAATVDVESFISYLLTDSGYYSFAGALAGGAARQENLRVLLNMAAGFEARRSRGLYSFVRFLEKSAAEGHEIESSGEENRDAVKLMTIHKSKGLEFPVVFVIGCGARFNERDAQGILIMNQMGIALKETDTKRRISYTSAEMKAMALVTKRELRAEQMRLLYVAMTRAKEKLVLIGTVRNPEGFVEKTSGRKRALSSREIRAMTDYMNYVIYGAAENPDLWDIHVNAEVPKIEGEEPEIETEEKTYARDDEIWRKLEYVYPFEDVQNIPSKMTVSEIKRTVYEEDGAEEMYAPPIETRKPKFLEEKKLVGAARGTAYHRVMELVDLNETDVKGAIEKMRAAGLLEKEEAECIDCGKIEAFLCSSLAEEMRRAKRVYRETPFTIMIDAKDVFENGGDEKITVQGTIDCFFEREDGEFVLVDYKTDYYEEPREIAEKYKKQLELYETAIFNKYSQKCDKKYLYLFRKNDIIEV
ncbi:MAG: helicase-exonuclease AddAB subunit AddA [Clostridia bacterium]|nr:helicase-exonuclease AddAB subunit AddA [Clostridia bacterium]